MPVCQKGGSLRTHVAIGKSWAATLPSCPEVSPTSTLQKKTILQISHRFVRWFMNIHVMLFMNMSSIFMIVYELLLTIYPWLSVPQQIKWTVMILVQASSHFQLSHSLKIFQNHFRCQGAEFHESSPDFARNPSAAGAVATCHPSLQLGISVQHHLPRKHLRHHGSPQWYKQRIKEPFRTTFLNQRCVACENSKEYSSCDSNLYNKSVLWIMKKNVVMRDFTFFFYRKDIKGSALVNAPTL